MRLDPSAAFLVALACFTGGCAGPRASGGASSVRPPAASASAVERPTPVATIALASITARTWRLRNGLEIVTLPSDDARSVSIVTAYRVGARDESAGEAGLAHVFEHLMFGTTRLIDARGLAVSVQFDHQIEALGGIANAETSHDFTSYVDDVPPDALAATFRLEASRMTNLELDAGQIARELNVVAAERASTVDDSVDGLLDEVLYALAFPHHPYGRPISGHPSDIQAVTKEKAVAFYRKSYGPGRAVLIVAGRFDETAALAAIAAAYDGVDARAGTGAGAPASAVPAAIAETGTGAARASEPTSAPRAALERPVTAERLVLGFTSPALADPDRPAFEVLTELLAGGPSSRLERALVVEREVASSVAGDVAVTRDPALWTVWVQLVAGHGAEQAEMIILNEIARIVDEPVPANEIAASRNRLETNFWLHLASSRERALSVGLFEMAGGGLAQLAARGGAYAQVTSDDVRRVARATLGAGPRSIAIARPQRAGNR